MSDAPPDAFPAARDASVGQLLLLAARLFHEAGMAEIQAHGHPELRATHFQLAPHIQLTGSRTTDIAARAGISKQAVGQIVDELESLGYVRRIPDPVDARARLVVYTDKGRAGMFDGLAALARVEARVAAAIPDVDGLRRTLTGIVTLLRTPVEPPMLTQHHPDLWTHAVDHPFLGLKFGARMTVVRLPDGGVWLHSPVPLTDDLRAAVSAVGPVRWIVAPNHLHHLYAGHWAAAFPDATLLVAPGLGKKRADLADRPTLDRSARWGDTLVPLPLDGQPTFTETAFFHPGSRTLIGADIGANLPPQTHLWTRFYAWMTGLEPRLSTNLVMRSAVKDRSAARRSIDAMLACAPERVIIAHGAIVEAGGEAELRRAWSWLEDAR